jgi:hypothetical protein
LPGAAASTIARCLVLMNSVSSAALTTVFVAIFLATLTR